MHVRGRQFLVDLGERTISTFIQALLAALVATGTTEHPGWLGAVLSGAFAAFVAGLTTTLAWLSRFKPITNSYVDLAYRTAMTFGQTLAGIAGAAGAISALDFDWSMALKASAIAAGTALLKGLIGLNNHRTVGASTLVRPTGGTHTQGT